jgi:hypothetical protein
VRGGEELGSALCGLEVEPAVEHHERTGFSVVAGPASEASGVGKGAAWVGVFLSFGLALELLAEGLDQGDIGGLEGIEAGRSG